MNRFPQPAIAHTGPVDKAAEMWLPTWADSYTAIVSDLEDTYISDRFWLTLTGPTIPWKFDAEKNI